MVTNLFLWLYNIVLCLYICMYMKLYLHLYCLLFLVEEEAEPKEKTPPPSPTPAKPAAYVPPSLRNHARGASNFGGPGRMPGRGGRRPDAPPDILSSEAFPTLGAN